MTEVLVTPDVEAAAVLWLRAGLGSLAAKVATTVPQAMPTTMVRVSLTGGARAGVRSDVAQLTVDCWAPDGPTASSLARRAEGLMHAAGGGAAGGVFVRRVDSVGSAQSLPDPDTNKPHYLFTVRWHVKPATI
jgi:hypothetical protein